MWYKRTYIQSRNRSTDGENKLIVSKGLKEDNWWIPNPQYLWCDCLWRQTLQRGNYFKMRSHGWTLIQCDCGPYKKRKFTQTHTQRPGVRMHKERWCQDITRGWTSTGQGERPQEKPNLPTSWSWTSSLQNCEKINACCLSHSVYDMFMLAVLTN